MMCCPLLFSLDSFVVVLCYVFGLLLASFVCALFPFALVCMFVLQLCFVACCFDSVFFCMLVWFHVCSLCVLFRFVLLFCFCFLL